jgi:hypothetical protein
MRAETQQRNCLLFSHAAGRNAAQARLQQFLLAALTMSSLHLHSSAFNIQPRTVHQKQ